jgi:hypothetical protein
VKKPSKASKRPSKAAPKKTRTTTVRGAAAKAKKTPRSTKAKVKKTRSKIRASAAPKGCCIIVTGDAPDRAIPGLTEAECDVIEDAHPGTATHWNPGVCA